MVAQAGIQLRIRMSFEDDQLIATDGLDLVSSVPNTCSARNHVVRLGKLLF